VIVSETPVKGGGLLVKRSTTARGAMIVKKYFTIAASRTLQPTLELPLQLSLN